MKKQTKRKASKKLHAIKPSRHLKLVPVSHSGKLVHKRNTSYPTLAMLMLVVGVFMMGWTRVVMADPVTMGGYDVQARVSGEAPTQPAAIVTPASGYRTSDEPITVSGTCPADTYVQLLRNDVASGVDLCGEDGNYSIITDLFEGVNILKVRVYNLADVPGPDSLPATVNYLPRVQAQPGVQDPLSNNPQKIQSPLILKSVSTYKGINTGDTAEFPLLVSGGDAPYAVAVDWGDGKKDLYSIKEAGEFQIEHKYEKSGGFKGSYEIYVTASDSGSQETVLQLMAIVNDELIATGATSDKGSLTGVRDSLASTPFSFLNELKGVAWQTYGVAVLMLASFWLGELHELGRLRPGSRRHKLR